MNYNGIISIRIEKQGECIQYAIQHQEERAVSSDVESMLTKLSTKSLRYSLSDGEKSALVENPLSYTSPYTPFFLVQSIQVNVMLLSYVEYQSILSPSCVFILFKLLAEEYLHAFISITTFTTAHWVPPSITGKKEL